MTIFFQFSEMLQFETHQFRQFGNDQYRAKNSNQRIKRALLGLHSEIWISICFQIEKNMIAGTVFLSIFNQMEFRLVRNQKEACHNDHISFNLKVIRNLFLQIFFHLFLYLFFFLSMACIGSYFIEWNDLCPCSVFLMAE